VGEACGQRVVFDTAPPGHSTVRFVWASGSSSCVRGWTLHFTRKRRSCVASSEACNRPDQPKPDRRASEKLTRPVENARVPLPRARRCSFIVRRSHLLNGGDRTNHIALIVDESGKDGHFPAKTPIRVNSQVQTEPQARAESTHRRRRVRRPAPSQFIQSINQKPHSQSQSH
jgi:hypothetical protein